MTKVNAYKSITGAILDESSGDFVFPEDKSAGSGGGGRDQWTWIEDALTEKYIFQYNEVRGRLEFTEINGISPKLRDFTDRDRATILRWLAKEKGIKSAATTLDTLLQSDYVPGFNPIVEWLTAVPSKGTGHIDKLAATIVADKPEVWAMYLRRWLIASVANVFSKDTCTNHTCLVLVGAQGRGKTTWFNKLLPADLLKYYFVGKIDVENKDTLSILAEYFIVNIDDQLQSINKRDEDAIKNVITTPTVTFRRPYTKNVETQPRIANICASVNRPGYLTDDTGSRRFLSVMITDVKLNELDAVDYVGVWAEAYAAYKANEKYWFDKNEIEDVQRNNADFTYITPEYEAVSVLFATPTPEQINQNKSEWLTNVEVCQIIKERTGITPKDKEVGKAFRRIGIEPQSKRRGKGQPPVYAYHLIRIDVTEQNDSRKAYEVVAASDEFHTFPERVPEF